eukprot:scaffold61895_cov23-Tisochrysis_lutea.AAC.2
MAEVCSGVVHQPRADGEAAQSDRPGRPPPMRMAMMGELHRVTDHVRPPHTRVNGMVLCIHAGMVIHAVHKNENVPSCALSLTAT